MDIHFDKGAVVLCQGEKFRIVAPQDLHSVLAENILTNEVKILLLSQLTSSFDQSFDKNKISRNNFPILSISEEHWQEAKRREAIIKSLVLTDCSRQAAVVASKKLGISTRYVYKLIDKYRISGNQLLSLLPTKFSGGKNKGRLSTELEVIIRAAIEALYLNTQKNKSTVVIEEILRRCHYANLKAPSERTIRRRIASLSNRELIKRRESSNSQYQIRPIVGETPEQNYPLEVFQMDHTVIDLIIVDEIYRQPIGRPYLTVAIDVFSRCVTGFYISLEPPSSTSVGLCLVHAVFDKENWLQGKNIEAKWPIWGKPNTIYVDNAKEFHSEALQRGCDAHGIKIHYRPVGQPHYGGIIERLIGTLMQLIHQIPGTTFSNIQKKGDYPSDKKAVLTLTELEHWLTVAITEYYHVKVHTGILMPPIEKYTLGILGDGKQKGKGYPPKIQHKQSLLIDFLPIERRRLQRHGFTLDHIEYFNNSLTPLIADREKYGKFIIRRDPRDISRIYALDPLSKMYLDIPYRTLSRPTITLWEHREAKKYLFKKGIEMVDEDRLFQSVEYLRSIVKSAAQKTKSARRNNERNRQAGSTIGFNRDKDIDKSNLFKEESISEEQRPIKPFEDIEIW